MTQTQVFFCEYWEIFKNTYFEEHLWTAVSGSMMLYTIFCILFVAESSNHDSAEDVSSNTVATGVTA